jgi:hypothetical protein
MEAHVKCLLLVYLDETWEKRSLAERQEVYWGQVRTTEEPWPEDSTVATRCIRRRRPPRPGAR